MELRLPEETRRLVLERFLGEPDVRLRLRNELIQFEVSGDSCVELLSNDLYYVSRKTFEEKAKVIQESEDRVRRHAKDARAGMIVKMSTH